RGRPGVRRAGPRARRAPSAARLPRPAAQAPRLTVEADARVGAADAHAPARHAGRASRLGSLRHPPSALEPGRRGAALAKTATAGPLARRWPGAVEPDAR